MKDLINREAVLALPRGRIRNMRGKIIEETINVADIENLPSEQLDDIPEEFREVLRVLKEKYDIAKEMRYINKPLEYALGETWQEFRRRNEVMR